MHVFNMYSAIWLPSCKNVINPTHCSLYVSNYTAAAAAAALAIQSSPERQFAHSILIQFLRILLLATFSPRLKWF